jgi:hypothetical protein
MSTTSVAVVYAEAKVGGMLLTEAELGAYLSDAYLSDAYLSEE